MDAQALRGVRSNTCPCTRTPAVPSVVSTERMAVLASQPAGCGLSGSPSSVLEPMLAADDRRSASTSDRGDQDDPGSDAGVLLGGGSVATRHVSQTRAPHRQSSVAGGSRRYAVALPVLAPARS